MSSTQPLDFTTLVAPPSLDATDLQNDFITSSTTTEVSVAGFSEPLQIYTEEVNKKGGAESKPAVLFLHGMRFSSKNWLDIQSLYQVANWGFRAVAVDLPGFGKSKTKIDAGQDGCFLTPLIETLKLGRPVIVSPSMSGSFSLPFLFSDGATSAERALGYVPVAPVMTTRFVGEYKKSQLPTLIVCGTNDKQLGTVSNQDLGHLPKGQYAPIEGAGHACYLDNPDAFHKLMYHFLSKLIQ